MDGFFAGIFLSEMAGPRDWPGTFRRVAEKVFGAQPEIQLFNDQNLVAACALAGNYPDSAVEITPGQSITIVNGPLSNLQSKPKSQDALVKFALKEAAGRPEFDFLRSISGSFYGLSYAVQSRKIVVLTDRTASGPYFL